MDFKVFQEDILNLVILRPGQQQKFDVKKKKIIWLKKIIGEWLRILNGAQNGSEKRRNLV